MIKFLRGTSCPFCLARVKELIKRREELRLQGIEVLVIIAAEVQKVVKSSTKNHAPFPIIADPEQKIFLKYGISKTNFILMKTMMRPMLMMKNMMTNFSDMSFLTETSTYPADFLIDENQIIIKAHYGKHLGDHLDV
ncbi:MAG: redoxin domain-containing protein [Flavobacteriales bacterium]|nr:redoxin domain-containing protein [Flavobacteriales bacterium]